MERPKPAPDVHLAACAALEATPAGSAALEDPPPGVAAATAPGRHTFPSLTDPGLKLTLGLQR